MIKVLVRPQKIISLILIVFTLLVFQPDLALGTRSGWSRINEINGQINDLKELRRKAEERKRDLSTQVDRIDLKVDAIEDRISLLDTQIARVSEAKMRTALELSELKKELVKRAQEYEVAQARLDLQMSLLAERASSIYMNDRLASLALFFTFITSSTGLEDLVMRFNLVNYILKGDLRILSEIQEAKAVAEVRRKTVEAKKRRVESLVSRFEHQRLSLSGLKRDETQQRNSVQREKEYKQKLLTATERDRVAYRERERELQAESAQIEAELAAQQGNSASQVRGKLRWSVVGPVTSYFGWRTNPVLGGNEFHRGIDISAATGTNIIAAASGVVIYSGYRGGYGKCIIIDHGGKIATVYAHQQELLASAGARVSAGQVIGKVDSTGFSTGPHLHFEVRVNGVPQNPLRYL